MGSSSNLCRSIHVGNAERWSVPCTTEASLLLHPYSSKDFFDFEIAFSPLPVLTLKQAYQEQTVGNTFARLVSRWEIIRLCHCKKRHSMGVQPLSPQILYAAYTQGYFPMPDEETGEILWYRPDPRAIIPLEGFHCSRSLRKFMHKAKLEVSFNRAFSQVIEQCAQRETTWINNEFKTAYNHLFRLGAAQSVEVWSEDQLVGGSYGVNFGGAFFAESMFYTLSNCSKVALFHLVERLKEKKFQLLECQFMTPHLQSLGAIEVPDAQYMQLLNQALDCDVIF